MGIRSTVKFYEEGNNEEPVLSVYNQFDGYIDGVGHDLANFLKAKTIINGISGNQSMENGHANGMGCLAAQYVAEKKVKIGGLYITTKDNSQDYDYEVRFIDNKIIVKVDDFEGTPEELLTYEPSEDED